MRTRTTKQIYRVLKTKQNCTRWHVADLVRNLVAALSVKVSGQVERPASAEPTADDDRVWALDTFADRIWRHGTACWTKEGRSTHMYPT